MEVCVPILSNSVPDIYVHNDFLNLMLQVKEEPMRRTRRRVRKYGDDDQEDTSRSTTPVQEIVSAGSVETPASAPRKRGRPRKVPVEEKTDNYSRSSTPVQDENILEDMEVVQGVSTMVEHVVVRSEQVVVQSEQPPAESESIVPMDVQDVVQGEQVVQSGQDVVQSEQVVVQSGQDVVQSEQVVVQSGQDVVQSEQDVVQSDQQVVQSDQSVVENEPSVLPSEPAALPSEAAVVESEPVALPSEPSVMTSEPSILPSEPAVESGPSVVPSEPAVAQGEEAPVVQSEPPPEQPPVQTEQQALTEQPVVDKEQAVIVQSEQEEPVEEMNVEAPATNEAVNIEKSDQDSEVVKEEVERMDDEPVNQIDSEQSVTETSIAVDIPEDVKDSSTTQSDNLTMEGDLQIGESPLSKEEKQDVGEGGEELKEVVDKDIVINRPVTEVDKDIVINRPVTEEDEEEMVPDDKNEVVKASSEGETEGVTGEQMEAGEVIPEASDKVASLSDIQEKQNDESLQKGTAQEADVKLDEPSLEKSEKEITDNVGPESEQMSSDKADVGDSEKDSKTDKPSEESDLTATEVTDAGDTTVKKTDEKVDATQINEPKSTEVPRPVLGHSPTQEDRSIEEQVQEGSIQEESQSAEKKDDTAADDNEELSVPALGSSPSAAAKVDEDETEADVVETKSNAEVKANEVQKSDAKKEDLKEKEESLVVPALGNSPTQIPTDSDKMEVEEEPRELDDNPPTPTQDEPSSMDEISPREADGEEKPAIPIYAVSNPSKSPLGGLFSLGGSASQEGPSSMQSSPAAARSVTGESSGAETNVDSEESAPSVTRETRQRPKRRVSTAQDADFEYSQPKRSRNETPPPPILEPELPIERPEEETRTRTTRASKQRHISPPHPPKESGVRTRHQSSQSTESQQSTRTPSPVPEQRVTRGRRSSRQSEDKQSHRYSDMVYYDTSRRSQRQQATTSPSPAVPNRRSTRRSVDDKSADKPTRGKRKR